MSNDNELPPDEPENKVLDFQAFRNKKEQIVEVSNPIEYEFHFHSTVDGESNGDVITATGYLHFGPAFIAVLDSKDAQTGIVQFAVATPMVKYIKKLGDSGEVQGTLSLS